MSPLGLRTTSCVGRIFISTIFSALWPFIYFIHLSYKNIYYFLGPLCWMPTRRAGPNVLEPPEAAIPFTPYRPGASDGDLPVKLPLNPTQPASTCYTEASVVR